MSEPDWNATKLREMPVIDESSMQMIEMQKLYSAFKLKCNRLEVWPRYLEQAKIMRDAGMEEWNVRKVLMPIWNGCLQWLSAGNSRHDWDFDKFKPKKSGEVGVYETLEVEIKRRAPIYEIIQEKRLRDQYIRRVGHTKDGPIIADTGFELAGIEAFVLDDPVKDISREDEVAWAYERIFEYQALKGAKKEERAREIMKSSPSYGACSWLEYANANFFRFMTDLVKNLPPDDGKNKEMATAEASYMEVISIMEKEFRIDCPKCGSKY